MHDILLLNWFLHALVLLLGFLFECSSLYHLLSLCQVFLLHPSLLVDRGDDLIINFSMVRSKENHRLLDVEIGCEVKRLSENLIKPFANRFYIE